MLRQRLKSRSGCGACRERRKKCDEVKPTCGACIRLQLSCYWRSNETTAPVSHALRRRRAESSNNDRSLLSQPAQRDGFRIADYSDKYVKLDSLPDGIAEVLTKDSPSQYGDPNIDATHHILISAILEGWARSSDPSYSNDAWISLSELDQFVTLCGHGKVARMACALLFASMNEYLRTRSRGTTCSIMLPQWYIPKPTDICQGTDRISIYFPWPAIRSKMLTNPRKYLDDRFLKRLTLQGWRFIWPYDVFSAISQDGPTRNFTFSENFLVRVSNIRSYAMAKDFLDAYPEFRGDAPQLEPSVTVYEPDHNASTEALYWTKVKERARVKQYIAFTTVTLKPSIDGAGYEPTNVSRGQVLTRGLSIRDLLD